MIAVYYVLILIAAILILMSIEMVMINNSILNISAAILLILLALLLGSEGLENYLLAMYYDEVAFKFYKLQQSLLMLLAPALFFLSSYFPRGEYSRKGLRFVILFSVLFLIPALLIYLEVGLVDYRIEVFLSQGNREISRVIADYHPIHWVYYIFAGILIIYSFARIIYKYGRVHLDYQKKQIRYFLTGVILSLVITLFIVLSRNFLLDWIRYLLEAIAGFLFGAIFLYSIINYRFSSVRKTVKRLAVEFLISGIVLIPIVLLFYLVRAWASTINILFFLVVFVPTFALLYRLHQALVQMVNKVLGRDSSVNDTTSVMLEHFSHATHLNELAEIAVVELSNLIECRSVDFLLYSNVDQRFAVEFSSTGQEYRLERFEPMLNYLQSDIHFYEREVINIDPQFSKIKVDAESYFQRYNTEVVVPVYFHDELPIIINIAEKFDETSYSPEELNLIKRYKTALEIVVRSIILFEKEQEAKINLRDLNLASQIQESIYQSELPEWKKIDVYAYQKPVKWVSGDYYVIEKINENKMGFVVADVSGKGIPAALIAMVLHSIVKSSGFTPGDPSALVRKMNEVLTSNISIGGVTRIVTFATVFCGFLDLFNQTLYYTNAGHLDMIIMDQETGKTDFLKSNAKPIGIFQDESYQTLTYSFSGKPLFVLCSDGITEAMNTEEEEFGDERLIEVLNEFRDLDAVGIAGEILRTVDEYAAGTEPMDDITLIIIKL